MEPNNAPTDNDEKLAEKDHHCFSIFLNPDFKYKNNIEDYYTKVAKDYDAFMSRTLYNGPSIVADVVSSLLKDKSAYLLDVCGGTGMSGQEVFRRGFQNIDYIDGSTGMMEEARAKGVYRHLYCEMLIPEKQSSLPSGVYDCVYSVGSYVPGHLQPEVAQEYIRIMKPGAYCVLGMREQWLHESEEYVGKLEPYMNSMREWKLVDKKVMDRWYNEYSGVVFVYQKC